MNKEYIRRFVHWSLVIVFIASIITGYGITQYRIVERLTFGLLSKNLAFRLHTPVNIALMILVVLHVFIVLSIKRKNVKKK